MPEFIVMDYLSALLRNHALQAVNCVDESSALIHQEVACAYVG